MPSAARRLLLRDVVVAASCGCLWWLALRGNVSGVGGTVLSVLAGVSTGVVAFIGHEWGHALGSKLSGATITFADTVMSPFLVFFDTEASTRSQFVAMSIGGYVASALAAVVALALLPRDQLAGQIGLAIVAIGVVATFIAEVPTTVRVARGGPMPRGCVYRSGSLGE